MTIGQRELVAVVIGRNEGERLTPSLRSVQKAGLPVIYVDSGSVDGSPSIARNLGAEVVELKADRPFSAARARNEGLAAGLERWPATKLILFLDGDCELEDDFPAAAERAFALDPKLAIATGHLTERDPGASIYNRLCAMEWNSAPGSIKPNGLGGIMIIRVTAFQDVGGFNEHAIAGEEPDLAVRLVEAGYSMIKIDHQMATHDAAILTFKQWWIRAVRGGHALAHHYATHGHSRVGNVDREVRSALFWGFLLPLLILILLWPTHGFSLILMLAYLYIGFRVTRYYRGRNASPDDARWASLFNVFSRFAHFVGMAKYVRNRLRGSYQIIEYKTADSDSRKPAR